MDNFTEKEFEEIYNFIKSKLIIDKEVSNEQIVYVLGGQPGAGKSTLTSRIEESMGKNIIAINGDDFRYSEKEFDNIEIFTREGKSLYSLKDTPNINPGEIIKKEFDRELTIEEKKKLIESYKKIKEKLNENDKNFQEVTKFLRTVNKNYNCLTGNQINIEAHSSAENKWISKKETKKYGIKVEEGAKETIGQITYIENNKLYQKPVSFYNISDLKITKEIEQKFVPIKEKEKAQEISKSKGQEIGD